MTSDEFNHLSKEAKRRLITVEWRKIRTDHKARLYWKQPHTRPHWPDYQRGDIAMIKDGPWRTYFNSWLSLAEYVGLVEPGRDSYTYRKE